MECYKALSLGPLLFSLYTTPLSKVILRNSDIKFYLYADDTQLFVHLSYKNAMSAFDKSNYCLQDVQELTSLSMLKLKREKTELVKFGSHAQLKKALCFRIFDKLLHPSAVVRNLCVWFDANFSFADNVLNICKTFFIQMRDLRWVRHYE